jgi:hypothetical protein
MHDHGTALGVAGPVTIPLRVELSAAQATAVLVGFSRVHHGFGSLEAAAAALGTDQLRGELAAALGECLSAYHAAPDPRACRVCPRGAIAVAAGRHPLFAVDYSDPDPDGEYWGTDAEQAERSDYEAIRTAEDALIRHLRLVGGPGRVPSQSIEMWADQPNRTRPQILAALRGAAQAERDRARRQAGGAS